MGTDGYGYTEEVQPEGEGILSYQAAYGTAREDTKETCGDIDNGFGPALQLESAWRPANPYWSKLARADGVESSAELRSRSRPSVQGVLDRET